MTRTPKTLALIQPLLLLFVLVIFAVYMLVANAVGFTNRGLTTDGGIVDILSAITLGWCLRSFMVT